MTIGKSWISRALVLGLLLATAAPAAQAAQQAYSCRKIAVRPYRGGGGGEVPFPFESLNRKVELADGETYALLGWIVYFDNQPYLQVDLSEHPWLATDRRQAYPYYPISTAPAGLARFEHKRVRLLVQAHGFIYQDGRDFEYVIGLNVLTDPVVAGLR